MNNKIILAFVLLLIVLPIINAQQIAPTVNYKIAQDITPQEALNMALENNPELKAEFEKFIRTLVIFIIVLLTDLILKGFAMWKAAKKNSRVWFWVLLLVTIPIILPLSYLILSKKHASDKKA